MRGEIRAVPFDLVVIDEAHKLRNAYRPSNKMGQNIRWAVEERRKLLLTATPLQNSLLELYGLSTVLDDMIFGDVTSFRAQYASAGGELKRLRERLQHFCKRTLRQQVVEYIQYTERRPITIRFRPTDDEQKLYEAVSALPPAGQHLRHPEATAAPDGPDPAQAAGLVVARHRRHARHDAGPARRRFGTS